MSEGTDIKYVHGWKNWSKDIAEAVTEREFLIVSPTDGTDGEGYEWMITPQYVHRDECDKTVYSRNVNSEKAPYPTLEAARDACVGYYKRERAQRHAASADGEAM